MLPDLDWRVIVGALWGGGVVWVYGSVLRTRVKANRIHHDRRSRRDLRSGIALFLTAVCASLATVFVIFGTAGSGIRGFMSAIALGAFLGAGFIFRGEVNAEAHEDPRIDT